MFTDSNLHRHRELEARVPGRHELAIFERYGHQDVFMGNRVHEDIFPRLTRFLDRCRLEPEQPVRAAGRGRPALLARRLAGARVEPQVSQAGGCRACAA